jgi:YegS/Rv2252/BmrU family lipid kinase
MRLIANPRAASGRDRGHWEALLATLRGHGAEVEVCLTEGPRHAVALARAATGMDVVVAVGGDGTVNEVVSGLLAAGGTTVLGIIPAGTGNDVARLVGLPDADTAVTALIAGHTRPLDLIEARCRDGEADIVRYACLYAAVGFASDVLRLTTPLVKRLFGAKWCYSVGFFRALWRFAAPELAITTGGRTITGRFFHTCAGNAEDTGGGTMRLSPGACMDDGLLDFCFIEAMSKGDILRHFPRLLAGTHPALPTVRYFRGTELSLESATPLPLALDGEVTGHTPATFRVLPAAVRVVCR